MPRQQQQGGVANGAVTRAKVSGGLLQTKRQTTGSVPAGGTADVVVTWPTAFTDANYTAPLPAVVDAANDLVVDRLVAQAAASITVRVRNTDTLNAATGTLHAIALHD